MIFSAACRTAAEARLLSGDPERAAEVLREKDFELLRHLDRKLWVVGEAAKDYRTKDSILDDLLTGLLLALLAHWTSSADAFDLAQINSTFVTELAAAGAIEFWDERVQIHGFYETRMSFGYEDFDASNEIDMYGWLHVLNVETEVEIAPDHAPDVVLAENLRVDHPPPTRG